MLVDIIVSCTWVTDLNSVRGPVIRNPYWKRQKLCTYTYYSYFVYCIFKSISQEIQNFKIFGEHYPLPPTFEPPCLLSQYL